MKYFVSAIIGIVAAAVVAGFFIVGSPQEERLRRFDDRRVSDLQTLQYQIVNHWQTKNKLPETLGDLSDSISGFMAPRDPSNGSAYEFRAASTLSFELCASFTRPSERQMQPEPAGPDPSQSWDHPAGRFCFMRTIDPDFYRPRDVSLPIKR